MFALIASMGFIPSTRPPVSARLLIALSPTASLVEVNKAALSAISVPLTTQLLRAPVSYVTQWPTVPFVVVLTTPASNACQVSVLKTEYVLLAISPTVKVAPQQTSATTVQQVSPWVLRTTASNATSSTALVAQPLTFVSNAMLVTT